MTRAEYLALAERAERAEGADRALDFMILKRVRGLRDLGCGLYEMEGWYYSLNDDDPSEKHPPFPSPTASLDAALSLVPEGAFWSITTCSDGASFEAACLLSGSYRTHPGRSPALALVAAALRARAEEAKDGE